MNPFLAHFASGQSLYSGVLLIVLGMLIELKYSTRWVRILSRGIIILGTAGIAASSVPQPWWLLVTWGVVFLGWRVSSNSDSSILPFGANQARIAFLVVTAVVLLAEIPHVYPPSPLERSPNSILIVGDSLTAGTYRLDPEHRWPALFESRYGTELHVIAQPGWTVTQAAEAITPQSLPDSYDAAVLVIGGNDVLRDQSPAQFRRNLEGLIQKVKRDRPVYMVELPLPPLGYTYGRIQRSMAARYDVHLIPKHRLTQVMTGRTLDGIHLSKKGHLAMARMIRRTLVPKREK
jgi:lysophospholipase L1-like esterase